MPLANFADMLRQAKAGKYAVGMFNALNLEMTRGILEAAEEKASPVIISLAEVHTAFGPINSMAPLLLKAAMDSRVPTAVHFDHGMSFGSVVDAMQKGFNSVMFDGSSLSFEENTAKTSQIVSAARKLGVSVEAELGHVGGAEGGGEDNSSALYTNVEQAADFVNSTGIDALAVAIGTAHGEYRGTPRLDLDRLEQIAARVDVPLVLHGGSGLSDDDFRNCIVRGICKINIFTDLSLAAVGMIREKIAGSTDYGSLINAVVNGVKSEALKKIDLFGSAGKAW